ncbi:capsular biosynthesis protein [Paroceanicella profunda]|uniref:Capsular biosynthesis protein n=1 Tax=Paroceanicella profunda TaxID=2579971 RepID=A0A5B8FVW9_9RHOB|nr:capsular biosynthesis protein [Paroceanicella profunda]QDL91554.1 capsular biosynthesis protein [Paroceanicella profunda]
MPTTRRHFLLLQGPCSWFFTYLAEALRRSGADVTRVIFCPGDRLFWRGPGAVAFRGRREDWPGFARALAAERGITDMVSLGDGRFLHAAAIAALRPEGVRVHLVEQGYLRPAFLTVEPDGTGGHSRFPSDPATIRRLAADAPPLPRPSYRSSFAAFSAMDVSFSLANLLTGRIFYPHYRTHALDGPLREWAGWVGKALRYPARARGRDAALARIAAHRGPKFLLPLQLETDYQIRLHGPEEGLRATLNRVIASHAAHAGPDAMLIVKPHPLDNGHAPWARLVRDSGHPRCVWLDGGTLDTMLSEMVGVVTVNSTVGLTALRAGVPVLALGRAIYDVPGLTAQDGLDAFWQSPPRPDAELLDAFLRALAATIQVPGNFDGTGARPGAEAVAGRLLAPAEVD